MQKNIYICIMHIFPQNLQYHIIHKPRSDYCNTFICQCTAVK